MKKDEIGLKVGKVINKYKMAKHFKLDIEDNSLSWKKDEKSIEMEKKLDGFYIIRTSEPKDKMSSEDTVRNYKRLTNVERAFRCLKSIDLLIRPINHRLADQVKAHIFICMLAYYIDWYMRSSLAPLLFEEEQLEEDRKNRDPVKPAEPSEVVKKKKLTKKTKDGFTVHSFQTMLQELSTRCKNKCCIGDSPPFYKITEMNPIQEKAFKLLGL